MLLTAKELSEKYGVDCNCLRYRLSKKKVKPVGVLEENSKERGNRGSYIYDEDSIDPKLLQKKEDYTRLENEITSRDIHVNRKSGWYVKGITDVERLSSMIGQRVRFRTVSDRDVTGILTEVNDITASVDCNGFIKTNLLLKAGIRSIDDE